MKKITVLLLSFLLGNGLLMAQQQHKPAVKPAKTSGSSQAAAKSAQPLKKDGTPDKRYKENKHLRKDGTPDRRYKENK